MKPDRFATITERYRPVANRRRRRLLPRPLPAHRPLEKRDLDRDRLDRSTTSSRSAASRARPARSSTTWSLSESARFTPSASAATTARATSCARALAARSRRDPRRLPHRAIAPHSRLLQAARDRARPLPPRTEPPRFQELDADSRSDRARARSHRPRRLPNTSMRSSCSIRSICPKPAS